MRRETLLDFFEDFEKLTSDFLVYDDGFRSAVFTYRDVARGARAFAARLTAAGIQANDKVMFYAENRPEWIVAFWGCLLAGVVVVPVDYRSSPDFVRRVQAAVQARIILTGAEVDPSGLTETWPLVDVGRTSDPQIITSAVNPTVEIIFTSGATAEPKGVVITHRNILANIVPVEGEVLKYRPYGKLFFPLRFLNLLPLSHMFGQAMATFIPPMLPGIVIFMRGFNPAEILRQIRTRRISLLVSVPKILEVLREHVVHLYPELANLPDTKMHWPRRWWRYRKVHRMFGWKFWSFIVGAAPLDPQLEAFWSRLGFLVIQGYGLTETAPIVTLNHPFHARSGSVGKPIAGVEVKIADDGEILVRGGNVTEGYYNAPEETAQAFQDGWFHTGDIGRLDETGRLQILGRKKELIVTPEGLNVFPEDVERVLNQQPGVRDSAVVGTDRVHAVLVLEPGANQDEIVANANRQLAEHQRIRDASVWPFPELPRTEGTGKLKRRDIAAGAAPTERSTKYDAKTPLDSLTSLERVELMVALDVDEVAVRNAKTIGDVQRLHVREPSEPIDFPAWSRAVPIRAIRRIVLPSFLLPLTRVFAHIRVSGLEHLRDLQPPVIFAPNHQSYMDVPVVMAALPAGWRYRVAPAMAKEFFDAHFHPERHTLRERFTNSLNYYLAALFFNAFPLPQREAGALETLRYMGEMVSQGWCVLIFPEGKMTDNGEIAPFQPGVGMLASKLNVPVVPVRIEGLDRVLHRTWRMATPGRVRVTFGPAQYFTGSDYAASARQLHDVATKL